MENRKPTEYTIEGHEGRWVIKNSWISDLGYIMIKFYNLEKKVFMNVYTGTTLEQALDLPWAAKSKPEGTNPTQIDTI